MFERVTFEKEFDDHHLKIPPFFFFYSEKRASIIIKKKGNLGFWLSARVLRRA